MLLTMLGEYVAPHGEPVWQETLIEALCALGYKVHAARQALARSVSGGWLQTERHGRRSRMMLTPDTTTMLTTGAHRIYTFGDRWVWDGRWLLVVLRVPEERRDIRHQMRTRLAWLGFGSLGGGLWITPHVERQRELADVHEVVDVLSFETSLGSLGNPSKVVSEAWNLDAVADAYRAFIARFGRLRPRAPEAVFRAQTELVHDWRKFPFLDPDLPEQVLPPRWPRARALHVFRERHDAWHATAQEYFWSLEALRAAA